MLKKSWLKIFILLVVVAGLAAGSYLVQRVQETRRGAAGGEAVSLGINPSQGEFAKGEQFTVAVTAPVLPEGKQLLNFILHLSLDNLEVVKTIKNQGKENEKVKLNVEAAADSVQIVSVGEEGDGILVVGYINTDGSFRGEEEIVKIDLKTQEAGSASISITPKSEITSCIITSCLSDYGSESVGEFVANYNVTEENAPSGKVTEISLSPSQGSFNDGDEFTVSLKADVADNKVGMASFDFSLSGGVELKKVDEGDDFSQIIASGSNRMVIIYIDMGPTPSPPSPDDFASGQIDIAKFKLKKTGNEPGKLLVNNIIIGGNDFGTKPVTSWSEPVNQDLVGNYNLISAGDVVVNFKIKFGGVNKKIGDQSVKVKVVGQGLSKTFDDVKVSADDQGVFSGQFVLANALPASGYALVIKGPKHLGTKFCQDGQDKRCLPGQSLTLAAGENNFDLSAYPLPPGDVSGKDSKQDGVVDVEDFNVVQAGLDVNSSAAVKEKGDLNFDSANNGSDPMLFLKTMAEKYDDDI